MSSWCDQALPLSHTAIRKPELLEEVWVTGPGPRAAGDAGGAGQDTAGPARRLKTGRLPDGAADRPGSQDTVVTPG